VTGSHTKHVAHTNVGCASCHTNPGATGHVSNTIDVSVGGYPAGKAKSTPYSNCSNISCHNGGNGVGAFVATPKTWGTALDCAGCHGYPPVNTNHTGVVAGTCNGCHDNVVPGGTQSATSFVDLQKHLNGTVEGGRCDSCHGYPPVQSMAGLGVNANYSSAKLQNYSGGGGVHNVAGHLALTTKPSLAGTDKFSPCLTCHPKGVTHNQGASTFLTANVQVVVDTQFKFDKNRPIVYNAKQSGTGKTSGTCANVSCHFQKSPIWSTQTYTQGH
jgi:predicted CxxxxCH...CXXCH cytochrome family protein